MDKAKTFLDELQNHHEKFLSTEKTSDDLISIIEIYESFIPRFFSATGEAEGIKKVYRTIKESVGSDEKTIHCVNINKSFNIYTDYHLGMKNFISEAAESGLVSEAVTESMKEKLETAKKNDSTFVESLYGGKLNGAVDQVVSEAVTNLECLIDFIPMLKNFKESCNSNSTLNSVDNIIVKDSITMMNESVENFCYHTIKSVVESYHAINEALFGVPEKKEEFTLL